MTDATESPAPSAEWSAPPAAPPRSGVTITLLPGQLLALAGGVLVVVSAWLDWFRASPGFGAALGLSAYDIPARFLVRDSGVFARQGGPSLGLVVLLLAAVCLLAAFARPVGFLALPAGLGAAVVAIWYALRLRDFLDPLREFGPGFGATLGAGVIMLGVGGALAIAGGIVSLTTRR